MQKKKKKLIRECMGINRWDKFEVIKEKKSALTFKYRLKDMTSNKVVFLTLVIILQQFFIATTKTNDDDPELAWSSAEGNSQNTYRIVPSMATYYSKQPWIYEYNSTIKDIGDFSVAAGINGDLYFFLSNSTVREGKCISHKSNFLKMIDFI